MPTVKIEGAAELLAQFRNLGADVPNFMDESLQAGAETILAPVLRAAPEKTGVLKGSISLRTVSSSRTRVEKAMEISSLAFYWRFLEFGTKFIQAREFIRKTFRNRKGTARAVVRDTFRDRVMGFKD